MVAFDVRESAIIALRCGNEELTLKEIAAREGISMSHAKYLCSRIIRRHLMKSFLGVCTEYGERRALRATRADEV